MRAITIHRLIPVLLFLLCAHSVSAKMLITFGLGQPEQPLFVQKEGEYLPLKIYNGRFSPPHHLEEGQALRLFRLVQTGTGPEYRIVYESRLSGSDSWILIVQAPTPSAPAVFAPLAFDSETDQQSQVLIYNQSSRRVIGEIGEERFALRPKDAERITFAQREEPGTVGLAFSRDEDWELFYSSRWNPNPEILRLLVVYDRTGENPSITLDYTDLNIRLLQRSRPR